MFIPFGKEKFFKYKTACIKITEGDVFDYDPFLPQYVRAYKIELSLSDLYIKAYVDFNQKKLLFEVLNKMKKELKIKSRGDP